MPHLCTQGSTTRDFPWNAFTDLIEDDEYDGMLIPKGSTVFLAIWAIHHNEAFYPDHERFHPDRFLRHPKLANEYATAGEYDNRDKSLCSSWERVELTRYSCTSFWVRSRSPLVSRHSSRRTKYVANDREAVVGI